MKIIAVDDEKIALDALSSAIRAVVAEDEVISFRYPEDAVEYVKDNPCDIAFLDIEMAGMSGVELAEVEVCEVARGAGCGTRATPYAGLQFGHLGEDVEALA